MFDSNAAAAGSAPGRRLPSRWRRALAVTAGPLALVAGVLAAPSTAAGALPARGEPAPLHAATGSTVAGSYLVVLKGQPGSAQATTRNRSAVSRAAGLGITVGHRYTSALNGFSAKLTAEQLDAVRTDPDVAYVAPDQVVSLDTAQTPATWGLDRVDQRNLPLDSIYDYTRTGTGVTAYIIDTGIRTTHSEFGGRATGGFTAISDGYGTNDCMGHGTHVAATVGGSTYGVAKAVSLVAVRVFGCSNSTTTAAVVAGVDWVTANHTGTAVANMSLGGGVSAEIDTAVSNSIASGVTYVVSAGNEYTDACTRSPAHLPAAITIGATDNTDTRPSFSNYGTCVDLLAPGVSITSAWNTSDTATNIISGTSMASPHATGAAALYLQTHPGASPAEVSAWLTGIATPGVLSNLAGSPNLLLAVNGPGSHTAMTWRVKDQRADNLVLVGSDEITNPYQGDTAATASLPLLCLHVTDAAIPSTITPDEYNGWSGGDLALTAPVAGTQLTSYTVASRICTVTFGAGWRLAEFHDGYYMWVPPWPGLPPHPMGSGWNLWGYGTLSTTTRFWTYIDDQPANLWD